MKKFLLLSAFSIFAAWYCHAQTISIDECVRLARANYPSVAQYGILDKVAHLNFANIAKAWLPHGNVAVQASWQNDVVALPDQLTGILAQYGADYPGLDKMQYRVGVDVTQQIWDGGKVRAGKKVIETETAAERTSFDVQLYDVEGRVEEIYFSLLLLNARISQTDKSITLVDSTLNRIRSMFANGIAMQSDCDQIEAKLLALRQQKSRLVAASGSIRRILEIFIGEPIGQRALVLPSENLPENQVDNHPQLRLFDNRLAHLSARESEIRSAVMPTVGAFASGYYGYPGYNMFKNMQSREMSFNFMVGVKVVWNFSSLYTRKNSLEKLNLRRNQVEIERATFNFNNDIAMSECMGQIAVLREIMRNDERIVELRHSVMTAAQSQLRNGVIDATTLLTKITDEEIAENDLTQHRIELVKAIYNLNHLRNK